MRPKHVCVLIPACNEEELLGACLRSVRRARGAVERGVSVDVVVVVDSSTDRTREIAKQELSGLGVMIETNAGAVGEARALAARVALDRFAGDLRDCWLANTDADCVVPADWLTVQLALAENGIDAIAGTIDVLDFKGHEARVEQRFRETYLIAPDGSHTHVHGANLGLRADVYVRAGGWSDLTTGEDHDLWKRLAGLNAKSVSVNRARVVTSGRRSGRAPHGFADALAAHNEKTHDENVT